MSKDGKPGVSEEGRRSFLNTIRVKQPSLKKKVPAKEPEPTESEVVVKALPAPKPKPVKEKPESKDDGGRKVYLELETWADIDAVVQVSPDHRSRSSVIRKLVEKHLPEMIKDLEDTIGKSDMGTIREAKLISMKYKSGRSA